MSIRRNMKILATVAVGMSASAVSAATLSPSASISPFGGIVVDATGLNGQRLLSHTAASVLSKGTARGNPDTNDFFVGQQGGFTMPLLDQLGGGFASFSLRVTLFDGDNDFGNFDANDNFLRVNNVTVGSFGDVVTTTTDANGNVLNGVNDGIGFAGDETDTGVFTLTDGAALAGLFTSLQQTSTLTFELDKRDTNGNFFDFTSDSRIPHTNAGFAPTLATVPLPAGIWTLLAALGGLGMMRRRAT